MFKLKVWNYIIVANTLINFGNTSPSPAGYLKQIQLSRNKHQHPLSYKYSYNIANNEDGTSQGKQEIRKGESAQGRYYVNLPRQDTTSQAHVRYIADDWGYHPVVQYSTSNAHSSVSAQFALGEQAVNALKNGGLEIRHGTTIPVIPLHQNNTSLGQDYVIQRPTDASLIVPLYFSTQIPVYQFPINQLSAPNNIDLQKTAQLIVQNDANQQNKLFLQDVTSNQVYNSEDSNVRQGRILQNGKKRVQNVFILQEASNGSENIQNEVENNEYRTKTQKSQSDKINYENYNKLVQNTQNLVSGADVLDINGAVEYDDISNITSATDQQLDNTIQLNTNVEQKNTFNSDPIIVEELSTSESFSISTTESNLHTSTNVLEQNMKNKSAETGNNIFDKARPVGIKFLAPITAALRITNAGEKLENFLVNDFQQKDSGKTSVEIQKSIPYYIGKVEYLSDLNNFGIPLIDKETTKNNTSTEIPSRIEYHIDEITASKFFESKKINNDQDSEEAPNSDSEQVGTINQYSQLSPQTLNNNKEFEQKYAQAEKLTQTSFDFSSEQSSKIVNDPISYESLVTVKVPVEVTKIVEKPIMIEKIVEKPVPIEVEKIIEKPLRIEIPVPQPVAVPVSVPQPYPVEVTKFIEKPVPQPYAVPVPITKLVSIPVPVKQFVERPYPVYIQFQKDKNQNRFNIFPYAVNYSTPYKLHGKLNLKQQYPTPSSPVHFELNTGSKKYNNYFGPIPPPTKSISDHKPRRNANPTPVNRAHFGKNLRIEYGFKPPMQPSVETDEFGNPLNKEDN